MYTITRDTVFSLNTKRVIATNDVIVTEGSKGFFVLNYWDQCSYMDVDVKPVYYIESKDERELYVLKKDNIILGAAKDICLV